MIWFIAQISNSVENDYTGWINISKMSKILKEDPERVHYKSIWNIHMHEHKNSSDWDKWAMNMGPITYYWFIFYKKPKKEAKTPWDE